MEYYLVIKKNKEFIHTSKFMNLEKHKAEQKDVWYDFICIQFWERQNYSHKKSRFVGAEDLGSGEGIDCRTRSFRGGGKGQAATEPRGWE